MKMRKLIGIIALSLLCAGCASTKRSTSERVIDADKEIAIAEQVASDVKSTKDTSTKIGENIEFVIEDFDTSLPIDIATGLHPLMRRATSKTAKTETKEVNETTQDLTKKAVQKKDVYHEKSNVKISDEKTNTSTVLLMLFLLVLAVIIGLITVMVVIKKLLK